MGLGKIFKIFENKNNKQWTISVNKTNLKSIDPSIKSKKDLIRKLERELKIRKNVKRKVL